VAISGDSVQITCASAVAAGTFVDYALNADPARMSTPFAGLTRWGLLRDSDPFVGAITKKAQPNYCVALRWRCSKKGIDVAKSKTCQLLTINF